MVGLQVLSFTRTISYVLVFIVYVKEANGVNLGLFAGDNKRHTSPLIIKKINRNTPVFININSRIPKLAVPTNLPQLKLTEPTLFKVKTPLSRNLPRSLRTPKIPKLPLLPLIPPLIPLLPPLLPPILSPLPILPPLPIFPLPLFPPLLPKLPKLTNTFEPLKVPILGKTRLQKALSSDIKPIVVPVIDKKQDVLKKLLELKRQGSLTTAEYLRFKKLLLRK